MIRKTLNLQKNILQLNQNTTKQLQFAPKYNKIESINFKEFKTYLQNSRFNLQPQGDLSQNFSDVIIFKDQVQETKNPQVVKKMKKKKYIGQFNLMCAAVSMVYLSPIYSIPCLLAGAGFLYGSTIDKRVLNSSVYQMEILEDHEHVKLTTGKNTDQEKEIVVEISEFDILDILDYRSFIDIYMQKDDKERRENREMFQIMAKLRDVNGIQHDSINFHCNLNTINNVYISNVNLFLEILDGQQEICAKYNYQDPNSEEFIENLFSQIQQNEQHEWLSEAEQNSKILEEKQKLLNEQNQQEQDQNQQKDIKKN